MFVLLLAIIFFSLVSAGVKAYEMYLDCQHYDSQIYQYMSGQMGEQRPKTQVPAKCQRRSVVNRDIVQYILSTIIGVLFVYGFFKGDLNPWQSSSGSSNANYY